MQTNKPFIITIDGPAGSGKTTTARALAAHLGFLYIDTGAMYRAVAYAMREQGIDAADVRSVCEALRELRVTLEMSNGSQRVFLNGEDIEDEIRSREISKAASAVSALPCVREAMVALQRSTAAAADGAVLEGRDIGTVVFPDAPCKIFLTADVRTRALRRLRQHEDNGENVDPVELEREIAERDRNDETREHAPLRKPKDAITVDTTGLTVEGQVAAILGLLENRMPAR